MEKQGSRLRLLPLHQWIIFVTVATLFLLLAWPNEQLTLIISDQETGEEYKRTTIHAEDAFTVQWVHSVEKTLWQETLTVNKEGEIVLTETRFRSFGAGVPNEKNGSVYFEGGFLVMMDLAEVKDDYQWIHSHHAAFTILKNGEPFLRTNDIPHHHKAEIIVKKG